MSVQNQGIVISSSENPSFLVNRHNQTVFPLKPPHSCPFLYLFWSTILTQQREILKGTTHTWCWRAQVLLIVSVGAISRFGVFFAALSLLGFPPKRLCPISQTRGSHSQAARLTRDRFRLQKHRSACHCQSRATAWHPVTWSYKVNPHLLGEKLTRDYLIIRLCFPLGPWDQLSCVEAGVDNNEPSLIREKLYFENVPLHLSQHCKVKCTQREGQFPTSHGLQLKKSPL